MPHPRRRNAPPPLRFSRKLVLHRWLLGLFGVERFDRLAEHLRDESLEGLDADNVHHFHHALCLHLPAERRPALPDEVLLEHDQAIVAVTARLNEPRIVRGEPPIAWKYFQYLALLFTEIYLDRWFRDPRALLAALNAHVAAFNEGKAEADRVSRFGEATTETEASAQINKLAFWMATGSGKTLLMHAHVLQYRRLLMRHGRTATSTASSCSRRTKGSRASTCASSRRRGSRRRSSTSRTGDRAAGGSSPGGRSRSWRSPSSGTRWGIGPSPWRPSRGTTSC